MADITPPARILVVDDETAQMKALCSTLSDQGYLLTGFGSPREALAAMGSQKFDLLLTDLMMPEMDGITLLRAALDLDAEIVGIMMTGHGTVDTAVRAMQVGALDYILKPFKLSIILPVIARALAVRRLRLENAQLVLQVAQQTSELEAANRELEAFSYSVAHDLRAPLRAVTGFSSILLEDYAASLSPEADRLLKRIAASAGHMGLLIDDLLRLSRLGRQPLTKQPLNVVALVQEVLHEVRKGFPARQVEIVVANLPDAVADRPLLRQVFVNLLSNAIKFTRGKDPGSIEVGWEQRQGETVYFVRDNGAGFDMQYAGKLFGVFQRLHRAEDFEGTGIGLSIAQRIIHRHGGRIWVEAQVDKGATFFFTLAPIADQPPAESDPHQAA